ncbi:cupin domain-containing protein [Psychroserpens burtonensis]|uniref:Cupin domain-containing protein n=1 Tax=Psychroserpens burtonensis TaxID=49278 RepID=A0A5C7B5L0_9FLAO|nr:cupin domain-containing protein [Psychroserpens burtonensis]TXE17051.1 cupin domain-containing protein [Psychroserpens burtonensis]
MYIINNEISQTTYKDLQTGKLLDLDAQEILLISLEKGALFPEHRSPRDANILVLEGSITFIINDNEYSLTKHNIFNFPKDEVHKVIAIENSKFLIIR